MAIKQTILFLRQENPVDSRELAIVALDNVAHKKGQPVVAYYKDNGEVRALLVVGKTEGVGKNYEIIANYSDVTALESKLNKELGKKLDTSTASSTYATKTELSSGLADKVDAVEGSRLMTTAEGDQINANKSAIDGLKTSLDGEIARAKDAEKKNADAISAETSRATGAEETLQGNIDLKADQSALTDHAGVIAGEALGHIKAVVGAKNESKGYDVLVDTEGKAFVNVPWENTVVDIPVKGVKAKDKVLTLGGDNMLSSTIKLTYTPGNSEKKILPYINLLGVNDEIISQIDATAFIKDGMIQTAVYNSDKKTIDLTFNTDGGGQTISVDVSALVNTYLAGDGLILNGNTFSVRVNETNGYLALTGEGQKSLTFNDTSIKKYADDAVKVETTRATKAETDIKDALGTKGTPSSDTAFGLIDSLSKTLATHKVKDIKGTAQQITVTSDNSGNYTIAFANDMLVDGGTF